MHFRIPSPPPHLPPPHTGFYGPSRWFLFSLLFTGLADLHRRARKRQTLAFAPGTVANHASHLKLFLYFSVHFELRVLPTEADTLLLFIEFLTVSFTSPKAVTNVLASLKFHHQRLGHSLRAFIDFRVKLALRSLPFTMRTHLNQAPPFPRNLLGPLARAAAVLGAWALPFRALVVLAFFTFARLSSLVPVSGDSFDPSRWPTVSDLRLGADQATLRLKYTKTRQVADGGFQVPVRSAASGPCPVSVAEELLAAAREGGFSPTAPLFATSGGRGGSPRSLSQSQARGFLGRCLGVLGLPPKAYSFHSFRRGGCSLAFARGAVEADLAAHGDWRSDAVRAYYPAEISRDRVATLLARGGHFPSLP